jgi:hypothetical protein
MNVEKKANKCVEIGFGITNLNLTRVMLVSKDKISSKPHPNWQNCNISHKMKEILLLF